MPVLKFRQAEYQALLRLDETIKEALLPLFVIPPVEYDFEELRLKKTALEHVAKLSLRLKGKWGDGEFLLDIDMSLHSESLPSGGGLIPHIYSSILSEGLDPTPVLALSHSFEYFENIKEVIQSHKRRVAFRIDFEELAEPENLVKIKECLVFLELSEEQSTLIIDFKDNADYSQNDSTCSLLSMLCGLWCMEEFRAVYFIGTSLDLSQIKKPGIVQYRGDWDLYKAIWLGDFPIAVGFGDYLVETPYFSSIDMRKIKPAAKLVYSYAEAWKVLKGGAFRDNPAQMRNLCKELINTPKVYMGHGYSPGDKRIYECSLGQGNTGNLGTWKEAAISHHLTLVVNQLSNFHEA